MQIVKFIGDCQSDGQKIERLIRRFYVVLPDRGVFIDGGAHVGYHTAHAMKFFQKVVAVEASPVTYVQHLRQRISQASDPKTLNVIPLNSARGCRERQGDKVDFFFSETHPGRSTVNTKMWEKWGNGTVKYDAPISASVVEIDDLRTLFAAGRPVDFIKLDLEGNEINALRGGAKTMSEDRPAIVMELGLKPHNEDLYGETCSGFVSMMADKGYALYAPWAEPAEEAILRGYPFWYVFALPKGERLDDLVGRLRLAYQEQL